MCSSDLMDLPHKVLQQTDRVRAAFRLWSDETSRREYVAQLEFRLHLNYDGLGAPDPNHYFAPDVYRLSAAETRSNENAICETTSNLRTRALRRPPAEAAASTFNAPEASSRPA